MAEKTIRILGIDLGEARTGVAISDPTGFLAGGIECIKSEDKNFLIGRIIEISKEYGVSLIVVGDPVNMDGSHGEKSKNAAAFAELLSEKSGIKTVLADERCTTMQAHKFLNETNTRGKKRKAAVDTLSAEIILQNYLDKIKK